MENIITKKRDNKDARKALRKGISKVQKEQWRMLCDRWENDPWGTGYKIVTKELKSWKTPYKTNSHKKMEIIKRLFPNTDIQRDMTYH
ncbi:hypothetical protein JTB14_000702 [Gonioctena quinquepunctata]|nr:hypothetical protein JTB14_000702 [Gonioctena quinquepunctata]